MLMISSLSFPYVAIFDSILLLLVNMICINLAGVITFLLQDIRPNNWWEANKAKKATKKSVALWSVLLAVLIFLLSLRI